MKNVDIEELSKNEVLLWQVCRYLFACLLGKHNLAKERKQ